MSLQHLIEEKGLTIYALAKRARIPYSSMIDLVKGKTQLERTAACNVYRMARVLEVSMEDLVIEAVRDGNREEVLEVRQSVEGEK